MAKIKEIRIQSNYKKDRDNKIDQIRNKAYHIAELYICFFPKVELDKGNGILQLEFKEEKDILHNGIIKKYYTIETTVNIYDKVYVHENIENMTTLESNEYFLEIIVKSMQKIASYNKMNEQIQADINNTADKIRALKYEVDFKISKLSKQSNCRLYRADVFRRIDYMGECLYLQITNKDMSVEKIILLKDYARADRTAGFKKALWYNNIFCIQNNMGEIINIYDCSDIMGYRVENYDDQFIKIALISSIAKKSLEKNIDYYLRDIKEDKLDGIIYITEDEDILQLYGKEDEYVMNYVKQNLKDGSHKSYSLLKVEENNLALCKQVKISSYNKSYNISSNQVLNYNCIVSIIKVFINTYDKGSFEEELYNRLNIDLKE